jgi:hypothetical protein
MYNQAVAAASVDLCALAAAVAGPQFRRQAGVRNAGNFPEVVEQVSLSPIRQQCTMFCLLCLFRRLIICAMPNVIQHAASA